MVSIARADPRWGGGGASIGESAGRSGGRVPKVGADEDGVDGDDAADALRRLVATKPRDTRVMKLKEPCASATRNLTPTEAQL